MGRWMHSSTIALITTLGIVALAGVFTNLMLTIAALSSCVLVLLWDRYRLARAMYSLSRRLHHNPFDAKLEVGAGAWGEVCHAVNRLLQQWRTDQHLQRLQPVQPALRQLNPLILNLPNDDQNATIAVLAIGPLPIANELDEMRTRIHLIAEPSERQQALIQWHDRYTLLVFGVLASTAEPLRSAITAATAMITHAEAAGLPTPPLALSSGQGKVAVLPLLGLHATGEPLAHAVSLLQQTPLGTLTCAEETYYYLRSAGLLPRSATHIARPARSYALALGSAYRHQNAE